MASEAPFPDIRTLLSGVRDGLELASSDTLTDDWRAVGLVLALQGALAAALVAYDTAHAEDVLDPASLAAPAPKLAPVSLLLRRAGSSDFLDEPERLSLSRADRRALEALIARRNRRLHPVSASNPSEPGEPAAEVAAALRVLRHLVIDHPAFSADAHAIVLADIGLLVRRLD